MEAQERCLACGEPAERWRLCRRDGKLLAGACYGKQRWDHPSRMQRSRAVVVGARAYLCPVCSRWHAGHRTERTAEVEAERVALVRHLRQNGNGWLVSWLADRWDSTTREDRVVWKNRGEVRA